MKNAKLQELLAQKMTAAVNDTPPVIAGTAETPSPTAPPLPAARPARKPAAVKPPAALAAVAPVTSTVSLYGPAADALRRLQLALMTGTGRNVSASAAVSVALEYAAAQLPGETGQLAELLAGVALHDKRRRQS